MSKLDKNYNWNGEYILLKPLEQKRFKISNLNYPEYLYIFINDDKTIRYTIIDDKFGMPSLANTSNTTHALELRDNSAYILNHLVYKEFIEKINCEHKNIIVAHYAYHVKGEIGDRTSCKVRCKDCGKVLFESKDKGVEVSYNYIEENKDKFESLLDMTCDSLNKRFNIKDIHDYKF